MSRQEIYLARQRQRLSDAATVAAAEVLDLPAPYLLAALHADQATDPAVKAAWTTAATALDPSRSLYCVKSFDESKTRTYDCGKNAQKIAAMPPRKHPHVVALTKEKEAALKVLRWCLMVPKIAPDSPRLAYYVSRWDVPGKIARAVADGTFDETTKDCPPIDLRHLPAGLAAIEEHERYQAQFAAPKSLPSPDELRLHANSSKRVAR